MPTLTTNLNETWQLEGSDYDRWEVVAAVTIDAIMGGSGIDDGATGSDIIVNGTVIARPFNASIDFAGVSVRDDSSSVTIGKSGYIDAVLVRFGLSTVYGTDIRNYGVIDALESGIFGRKGIDIENHGTIRAENGIEVLEGNFDIFNTGMIVGSAVGVSGDAGDLSVLVNEAGGTIRSNLGHGVYIRGNPDDSAKIINAGLLKGGEYALRSDATVELINRGTMVGDISTSAGADTINTRDGTVRGTLYGGEGNDTYIIGQSKVSIVEQAAGGNNDFVQSTVTCRLTDNVEALQLAGRKNINATGNDGANTLTGNVGNNILSGREGADALYGRQGDDRLIGGGGGDVFAFGDDYDHDRIMDFEDGIDLLYLPGVTDQQAFDALNIRQSGDDLIINHGRGDQLNIENLRKQNLTLDDLLLT